MSNKLVLLLLLIVTSFVFDGLQIKNIFPSSDLDQIVITVTPGIRYEQAVVSKVVDGDTIDIMLNGKKDVVRFIGIDSPEIHDPRRGVQCFGKEAAEKAKEILSDKTVRLESDPTQGDRDKYQRLLRYVFLPDGTNINEYMIAEGYAHEYTYNLPYKYQKEFKEAERKAREANRGLWNQNSCKL